MTTYNADERAAVLEALLLVSPQPLTLEQVMAATEDKDQQAWEAAFSSLEERFKGHTGILLQRAAAGWRLVTAPGCEGPVNRFLKITSRQRLSRAAFEVLAIAAYHQPITIPEINQIRGANSAGSVNTLLEKRLLKIVGRKPVVGRPFLFGTTKEFLLHFGLDSLDDLPKMEEMDAFKAE